MGSWGIQVTDSCYLCSAASETRLHIFIDCLYTQVIWASIFSRLGLPGRLPCNWDSMLEWTKVINQNSPTTLRLLLVHALVYNVWRQRNNYKHNHIKIPPLTIFRDIDRQIINSITARRHLKNFRNLMPLWLH